MLQFMGVAVVADSADVALDAWLHSDGYRAPHDTVRGDKRPLTAVSLSGAGMITT